MKRALLALAVALAGWGLAPTAAGAQIEGLDQWAEAVVHGGQQVWEGPVTEAPEPRPRPAAVGTTRSVLRPVSVHAGPAEDAGRIEAAIEALEAAHDLLAVAGWDPPPADGGRGGTAGFDLYFARSGANPATAHSDGLVTWSYLDSVSAFGVVDPSVRDDELAACVTQAYAEAILLGQDPAEATTWRRSTAALLTWMSTGEWGCGGEGLSRLADPWRSWFGGPDDVDAGGAPFLAMLSARHDGGTGAFVRQLWQHARQRTWADQHEGLRASPDLWEALTSIVEHSPDRMVDTMEHFGIARWYLGDRARERGSSMQMLNGLPSDTRVEPLARYRWSQLPRHTQPAEPALEPHGTAFIEVDVSGAEPDEVLRIWLYGEYGVRWSLNAIKLDARGRELGRLPAPPRRDPRSYLILELTEGTDRVLIAVTNLSSRTPDADEPDENVRSFKLVVGPEAAEAG